MVVDGSHLTEVKSETHCNRSEDSNSTFKAIPLGREGPEILRNAGARQALLYAR